MYRSYIIRLFPSQEQEQLMWQHIGSCRFIWNYMLDLQQRRRASGEKHLSRFDMINQITPLKHDGEHDWLNSVSRTSLDRVCQDLAIAYDRFFSRLRGFPKLKSRKRSRPGFPVSAAVGKFYFTNNHATIPKIGKVPYKTNYDIPQGNKQKFINPRIQYTKNGKWILTVDVECENQAPVLTDKPMGIDLGVKELAVVAFGDEQLVFHNINKSKRMRTLERKGKHIQRVISHKYRTNGNYEKTNGIVKYELMYAEICRKISNIRKNYLHQTTHTLISKLPKTVVMEDLNVKGMMKNRHLSKAIQGQCLSEFTRQMRYKCEGNGVEFIQVDRFYPSSKTCSRCGQKKVDLKLSDRTFKCSHCGLEIDRDYNAAINLMRCADKVEMAAA